MELTDILGAAEIAGPASAATPARSARDGTRSEDEYRAILKTTLDAFWVNDLSGRFLDANDAYCQMVGYAREELLTMSLSHVEAIETPEDTHAHIATVIETGFDRFESRHRRKDGVIVDIEVTVTYLPGGTGRLIVFARDVTTQNQDRAALHESEEFNRRIIASSSDCIKVLALDGTLLSMSESGQRLMEIEDVWRYIGTPWNDFWEKKELPLVEAALAEARAGRQGGFRASCPSTKGTPKWWDVIITPILGEDGWPERLLAVSRDVTARVSAELAAKAATQRFETLAAASFEGIAITVAGRLIDANDRLTQMFGYDRNEVIGRHVAEFMSANGQVEATAAIESGRESHAEYEILCKDGSRRLAEVRGRTIEQDGRMLRLTAVRDITEHRRAEQTIRESEARLRAHIENSPMGVVAWDSDFTVTQWSDEAERIFGWTAAQTVGKPIMDLNMIYPEDIPLVGRTMAQLSAGTTRYVVNENRNLTKDGRVIHCVWYNSNLRGEDGTMTSILSQVLDITERKRAEDALRSAKLEAERANDAKSRFLAAVSHDLRQPLSALSLYVGALDHKLGAAEGQLLSNMKNCVCGLNEMLSNLLNLSRLEAGAVVPKVSDFLVATALAKVVSAHEPEARSKRLQLRRCYPELVARTDPVLFQRIVGNLIANAIRYTERGGILIVCRHRRGKTWLEVWDTGVGIPADKTTEIFAEFKQLGNSERNRVKGTGLGLAIVVKTAAVLGLEVRVNSRLGRGSVFAVELPLGTRVVPATPPRQPCRPLRIALVEDDSHVAAALAYALGQRGHQLVSAESAEKLMPLLNGEAPQIVISDYRLAGPETGVGVVAAVRERFGADLPAIIITGDTEPSLIRLIEANAIRLLHKPLDIDVLQGAIAESLG